jgi:hypothetical protein
LGGKSVEHNGHDKPACELQANPPSDPSLSSI